MKTASVEKPKLTSYLMVKAKDQEQDKRIHSCQLHQHCIRGATVKSTQHLPTPERNINKVKCIHIGKDKVKLYVQ